MRTPITLAALLVLVLALSPGPARSAELREQSSRDWDAAGISRIEVSNARGLVSLTPSRDGRIHLVALKLVRHGRPAESAELARKTRVEAGRTGDRLWIHVTYPQRREIRVGILDLMHGIEIAQAEVRLSIEAPATFALDLETSNGDLESDGFTGAQVLHAVSGDVTVGSARGSLDVETTSGDAQLEDVAGARVQTTSGEVVVVSSRGPLRAESQSGNIRVESADDSVSVTSSSGEIHVGLARGGLRVETGSGDVTARAGGSIRVSTSSGEVQLGLTPRFRDAEIRTGSGDVELRLPEHPDCRIDAETSSGSVDVNVPMDLTRTGTHRIQGTIGRGSRRVIVRSASGSVDVGS